MDQATQDALDAIFNKDSWTVEDHQELCKQLAGTGDAADTLRARLGEMESAEEEPKGTTALKLGIARYMACRFDAALDVLSNATDNKDRRYFQGQCYKQLRQYDKALEELQRAKDRGFESPDIDVEIVEVQALGGHFEDAAKELAKLEKSHGDRASFQYVSGLIDELQGRYESAAEAYDKALSTDGDHAGAMFRLAYFEDLRGDEERAMELYRKCAAKPPVPANALLNLAVLYEDQGKYDQAVTCLRRILAINPNHARARLFLRDCEASKTMYFDEEQAKRIARRNAVLDIPVTDFELSVRARNCLKKMNIRTLGDLVKTTEAELLGYKNFGETSLKEIKEMLSAKGLRLGMAMEEGNEFYSGPTPSQVSSASSANEGLLATPLEHIEFSVRSRRALETLGVRNLGDLASKTEAELLACKNFGQTSLNEIRQRLAEYGVGLREPH